MINRRIHTSILSAIALIAVIFAVSPVSVFAEAMQSGSYHMDSDAVDFAGTRSTSASYTMEDTAGESATGDSSSANSINHAGFQQAAGAGSVVVTPPSNPNNGGGSTGTSGSYLPINVIDFAALPRTSDILLSWRYPTTGDIQSVRIVRSTSFFPTDINDGEVIFEGAAGPLLDQAVDHDVKKGVTYYYAIFTRTSTGAYSSGVLATARIIPAISNPGNPSLPPVVTPNPVEIFAGVVQAPHVDPAIQALSLLDFEFIQDGHILSHVGDTVAIDGSHDLTIRLSYSKVPEVLKTIAFGLVDPTDASKVFSFLLRADDKKTYYEATIGPLGKSGTYNFQGVILDYKNQSLKRLSGDLRSLVVAAAGNTVSQAHASNSFLIYIVLALIIILAAVLILARHRNKKGAAGAIVAGFVLYICITSALTAHAAINKQINYQGKLANSADSVVTDGGYNIRFNLYTTPTGGSPIWSETWCYSPDNGTTCDGTGVDSRAQVKNGLFSLLLGSVSSLANVNFDQTLYLGVEVGGSSVSPAWDGEMSPRKKLGAVPAAFVAQTIAGLENAVGPLQVNNGVITSTSTIASVFGGTGISSYNAGDILFGNAGGTLSTLPVSSNGLVLKLVGGMPTWSADLTGASGGAGAWATTSDSLAVYPADTTNVVIIGGNATTSTGNQLEVIGNTKLGGTATISNILATGSSTLQNVTFQNATGTAATTTNFYSTTASSTNLYSTNASVGLLSANTVSAGNLSVGTLSGVLVGTNGAVSAVATSSLGLPQFSDLAPFLTSSNAAATYLSLNNWYSTTTDQLKEGTNNLYFTPGRVQSYLTLIGNGSLFSTTSASFFLSQNQGNAFSTSSANFFLGQNQALAFSTTSAAFFLSQNLGNAFSTSSASFFLSQNQGNAFSTSSAGFFLAQNQGNAFSTSSANFFLGQNQGLAFSTSSANYFLSQNQAASFSTTSSNFSVNAFIAASTTIPKTYSNNVFSGNNTFNGSVTVGSLNGPLQANNGVVSATSSVGVLYGGTGLSTAPALGQILVGNSTGGYTLAATSSLGLPQFSDLASYLTISAAAATYLTQSNAAATYLALSNWYSTTTDQLKEGSVNKYYTDSRVQSYLTLIGNGSLFSTTSASFFLSQNQGNAFSTSSAGYFLSQNLGNAFSTSSASFFLAQNQAAAFSTTSSSFFLSQNQGNAFSTSSANAYINASSTIAHPAGGVAGNLIQWDGTKWVSVATSSLGISSGSTAAYPFGIAGNATSTLTQFNGGLTAYASSTIGGGATTTGLTINGGATTTLGLYVGNTITTGGGSVVGTNIISGGYVAAGGPFGNSFYTNTTNNAGFYMDGPGSTQFGIHTGGGGAGGDYLALRAGSQDHLFIPWNTGYVGVGTTTPWREFSVVGSSDLGNNALAGSFTATSSVASVFPYASTTALTATTLYSNTLCLSGDCRTIWPTGTGGAAGTWSTTTSQVPGQSINYSNAGTDIVAIGANSTSSAKFFFDPNAQIGYVSGKLGIGTSSPWKALSVAGDLSLTGGLYDGSASAGQNGYVLQSTGSGIKWVATSTLGLAGAGGSSFAYPFGFAGNATSTLTQFNGGLTAYASSTVGNGNLGLTVNGTATTTGSAYFAKNVGIGAPGNTSNGVLDVTALSNNAVHVSIGDQSISAISINNNSFSSDPFHGFNFFLGDTGTAELLNNNVGVIALSPTGGVSIGSAYLNNNAGAGNLIVSGNVGIGTTSPYAKLAVDGRGIFNQDVRANYFTATSTTQASTFALASTTVLSASTICITTDCRTAWPTSLAYPFGLAGNATSTLTQFNGGLTAYASSTIGGGTGLTGLTINGNSTTTGSAYFATSIGIGTSTPATALQITNNAGYASIQLGPNSPTGFTITKETTDNSFNIWEGTFGAATGGVPRFKIMQGGNVGLGTSSPYAKLSVDGRAVFNQDVRANYFTATSTTQASTFALASTTVLSASTLCLSTDCRTAWPTSLAYPFGLAGNATSTLTQFNGGLTAFASSTIGNGTQTGGLTINGGATTTGNLLVKGSVDAQLGFFDNGKFFGMATATRSYLIGANTRATSTPNTGADNFFAGDLAGSTNTIGSHNFFAGPQAGALNTSGSDNIFMGSATGDVNTIGSDNAFLGAFAGGNNTTGKENIFMGDSAGCSNDAGSYNVMIGMLTGCAFSNGAYQANTILGVHSNALNTGITASTTVIGYDAGANNSGNLSTLLGYRAGYSLTTGNNNIAIGSNVDLASNTLNNQLNIGNLIYGTGIYSGSTPSSAPAGGSVGIGTTSPWRTLSVAGNSDLGMNALAGYFTATSTIASTFINASTTVLSASTICITTDCRTAWPTLAYPFGLAGNATSTLTQFNGGLTAYASSTIGNGNLGLTVNGTATTTGIAYFANTVTLGSFVPNAAQISVGGNGNMVFNATTSGGYSFQGFNTINGGKTTITPDGSLSVTPDIGGVRAFEVGTNGLWGNDAFAVDTPTDNSGGTIRIYGQQTIGTSYFNLTPPTDGLLVQGNVGIGTTSPYAKLSVAGQVVGQYFTATSTTQASIFALASTTVLSANTLCLSTDCRTAWPAGYAFTGPGNSTTTLVQFNGGLTSYASTTIGNGTQVGGLTVSGGATTTGNLAVLGTGTTTLGGNLIVGMTPSGFLGGGSFASNHSLVVGGGIVGEEMVASGIGSIAFGYAHVAGNSDGTVQSLNKGTLAGGAAQFGFITASGQGSVALGFADSQRSDFGYTNITASGDGSFAGGHPQFGSVIASGSGSFFWGEDGSSTAAYSTGFGKNFQNNQANSFMVGYSATPTLTVNATGVGIGTTSPWRALSVVGSSDLGNNALAGFFTATSSTASAFNGGFTAFASSTIGNGRANGGLTVVGNATTTGTLFLPQGIDSVIVGTTSSAYLAGLGGGGFAINVAGQLSANTGAAFDTSNPVGYANNMFVSGQLGSKKLGYVGVGGESLSSAAYASRIFMESFSLNGISLIADTGDVRLYTGGATAANQKAILTSSGQFGIGTTSPWRNLSVAGTSDLGINALAGSFTATSTVASSFINASTTVLSANTFCLATDCRTVWPGVGAGTAGTWSTTTSQVSGQLVNYSNNNSDIVAVGGNSTSTAKFFFDPNQQQAYLGSTTIGSSYVAPRGNLELRGTGVNSIVFSDPNVNQPTTLVQPSDVYATIQEIDPGRGSLGITGTATFPNDAGVQITGIGPSNLNPGIGAVSIIGAINAGPGIDYVSDTGSVFNVVNRNRAIFNITGNGNVGIGTTTPYAALSVIGGTGVVADHYTATSTSVASVFPYASTTALTASALCLATDCRTAWPAAGTYPFQLAGNATSTLTQFNGGLTAYASSTIGGGATTTGLTINGFATTTLGLTTGGDVTSGGSVLATSFYGSNNPFGVSYYTGSINGTGFFMDGGGTLNNGQYGIHTGGGGGSNYLALKSGNADRVFVDATTGNVGMGTSTPWRALSVVGSSDLGNNALAGSFTATSSIASTFPYASTTALSAQTICLTGDICRTAWPVSGAAYPFALAGNATSTLTQFNAGLTAFASSTIGNGNLGLTVSGNSTTTGNAYFASNVGIGTSLPATSLHVNGASATPSGSGTATGQVFITGAGTYATVLGVFDNGTTPYSYIQGQFRDNAALTKPLVLQPVGNNVGVGSSSPWAQLSVNPNGVSGPEFAVGSSTKTDFVVANSGKVGVGTSIPFAPLHVNGSSAAPASSGTANGQIFVTGAGTYSTIIGTFDNGTAPYSWIQGQFRDNANLTNPLDLQPIGGNVGLGTSSPYAKLSVDGRGVFNQDVRANYFTATSTSIASTFPYASTTALSAQTICLTGDTCRTSWPVSGAAYAFQLAGNATSTLTQFNGGLTAYASSTIGNGNFGLTVNGNSTTTANAYFGGFVGIGSTSPMENLDVVGTQNLTLGIASNNIAGTALYIKNTASGANYQLGVTGTSNGFGAGNFVEWDQTHGQSSLMIASSSGNVLLGGVLTGGVIPGSPLSVVGGTSIGSAYTALAAPSNGLIVQGNVGIGTSSPYAKLSVDGRGIFNQDVRANYFTATSTTQASTFALASTTVLSASTLCISTDCRTSWPISGAAYPFQLAGNATSTLTQFNAGLTAFASSTIGNGTQTGGLTISGNATTTGIAYANKVSIGSSPLDSTTELEVFDAVNGGGAVKVYDNTGTLKQQFGSTALNIANSAFLRSYSDNLSTMKFEVNGSNGNGYFAGAVGIGTTSPSSGLLIATSTGIGTLTIKGASDGFQYSNLGFSNIVDNHLWVLSNRSAASNAHSFLLSAYNGTSFLNTANFKENGDAYLGGNYDESTNNGAYLDIVGGNVGIGTSSPYAKLSVDGRGIFNQDVRANYFTATSTSIASTFPYASTTAISAQTICLTGDTCRTTWPSASGAAYPFGLAGNATSTLTQFNAGLTSFASSTIGNGNFGLTISGNSTTTGNAYFASNVGIGTTSPASRLDIVTSGNSLPGITIRDIAGTPSLEIRAGTSTLSNAFIGAGAGVANTTGNFSTAFGAIALAQNTTGSQNAAGGYEALFHNTSGFDNTASGYAALLNNTTGNDNSGFGWQALQHNTTGSWNAALGGAALGANSTGSFNVGVGWNAGYAGQGDFSADVFVGYKTSWNANSPMSSTTEVGYEAGYNYAGNFSTLLGYQAGYNLASGNSNIALGANVDLPSSTGSGQLNIGNLLYGTGIYSGSTPSSAPAGGMLGIGTSSPWRTLSVAGNSDLGINALAGYFTATSSIASSFINASTTVLSSNTICLLTDCRTVWPSVTGGSSGTWSTTTSQVAGQFVNYSLNNSDIVAIGGNSTTTADFFFDPNQQQAYLGSTTIGSNPIAPRGTLEVRGTGTNAVTGANPTIVLSNPNMSQPATSIYPSDIFGTIGPDSNNAGSLAITGLSSGANAGGIELTGYLAPNVNQGVPAVAVTGYIESGNARALVPDNQLVFGVFNGNCCGSVFNILGNGNVGIGTSTAYAKLSVVGQAVAQYFTATSTSIASTFPYASTTAISAQTICLTGDTCRTTWPSAGGGSYPFNLAGNATSTLTQFFGGLTAFASSTIGNGTQFGGLTIFGGATTTGNAYFGGTIGIGTSTPWRTLSVSGSSDLGIDAMAGTFTATSTTGTSVFAGNLNVGSGSLVYDSTSGITSISNLLTGPLSFDTDAGVVSWTDMPIDSLASSGSAESYTAQLDGQPALTVFGTADGSGNLASGPYVGIATTTPWRALSVNGNSDLGNNALAGSFTATSTTATSTFAGFIDVNGTGTNATSTFASNLWVKGALKVGTNSLYIDQNGITNSNGQTLNLSGAGASNISYASTTALSVAGATYFSGLSDGCLNVTGGLVGSTGSACGAGGGGAAYAFGLTGNATSTLTQFNGGLTAFASSTIGNGNFGLTVNGTATTTGNAYFASHVGIGTSTFATVNSGVFNVDAGSANNISMLTANVNDYAQSAIINANKGSNASADFIVGNDLNYASSTIGYGDLGINSSVNTDNRFTGLKANDTYLYSSDGSLALGTASTTGSAAAASINFFTQGLLTSNLRMTISNTGNVGIGTSTPWRTLSVTGNSDLGTNAMAGSFTATASNATSTFAGALQVGSGTIADAAMQFGTDPFAWNIGYKSSDSSFRFSSSTALGSNDVLTLTKNGKLTLTSSNSADATSTINGNLYVNGTLRGTNVYSGDLIFANNFRFTEASTTDAATGGLDGLYLKNQNGADLVSVDAKGNMTVTGDVCANGVQCYGKTINDLTSSLNALASSTAMATSTTLSLLSNQQTYTNLSFAQLSGQLSNVTDDVANLKSQVAILASTTASVPLPDLTASTTFMSTVASSTADVLASSTPSFIQRIASAVTSIIQSTGEWVVAKLSAHVVYADRVETQVAAVKQGLEMTDQATGQVYCVVIKNGNWDKNPGPCGTEASTTAATTPVVDTTPVQQPVTQAPTTVSTPVATSTATSSATATDTATSTPAASTTPTVTATSTPAAPTTTDSSGTTGTTSSTGGTTTTDSSTTVTTPSTSTGTSGTDTTTTVTTTSSSTNTPAAPSTTDTTITSTPAPSSGDTTTASTPADQSATSAPAPAPAPAPTDTTSTP